MLPAAAAAAAAAAWMFACLTVEILGEVTAVTVLQTRRRISSYRNQHTHTHITVTVTTPPHLHHQEHGADRLLQTEQKVTDTHDLKSGEILIKVKHSMI